MKIIYCLIIISLLLLLESCNSVEPEERTGIDSTIKFKIYETFPGENDNNIGNPSIYLYLFTEKEYPCLGYQLNFDKHITGKNIDINFHSIKIPGACATAFGPATAYVNLDLPNGEYNLTLKVNRRTDNYIINISDSEIRIKSKTTSRISESLYNKYFRFPKLSFAYYCGTSIEYKYICEDFLDTLKSKVNVQEFNFPEDGQKPYPDSLGGRSYEMAKYYLYKSASDFEKIGEVLRYYKQTVIKNDEANISIYNWQNKYYYSWLY